MLSSSLISPPTRRQWECLVARIQVQQQPSFRRNLSSSPSLLQRNYTNRENKSDPIVFNPFDLGSTPEYVDEFFLSEPKAPTVSLSASGLASGSSQPTRHPVRSKSRTGQQENQQSQQQDDSTQLWQPCDPLFPSTFDKLPKIEIPIPYSLAPRQPADVPIARYGDQALVSIPAPTLHQTATRRAGSTAVPPDSPLYPIVPLSIDAPVGAFEYTGRYIPPAIPHTQYGRVTEDDALKEYTPNEYYDRYPWMREVDQTLTGASRLDAEINAFANFVKPTQTEAAAHQEVYNRVVKIITELYDSIYESESAKVERKRSQYGQDYKLRRPTIELTGSVATNSALCSSDIDINITLPDPPECIMNRAHGSSSPSSDPTSTQADIFDNRISTSSSDPPFLNVMEPEPDLPPSEPLPFSHQAIQSKNLSAKQGRVPMSLTRWRSVWIKSAFAALRSAGIPVHDIEDGNDQEKDKNNNGNNHTHNRFLSSFGPEPGEGAPRDFILCALVPSHRFPRISMLHRESGIAVQISFLHYFLRSDGVENEKKKDDALSDDRNPSTDVLSEHSPSPSTTFTSSDGSSSTSTPSSPPPPPSSLASCKLSSFPAPSNPSKPFPSTTYATQHYLARFPALLPTYAVIKTALDIRGMTDVYRKGLPSYGVLMMIVAGCVRGGSNRDGKGGIVDGGSSAGSSGDVNDGGDGGDGLHSIIPTSPSPFPSPPTAAATGGISTFIKDPPLTPSQILARYLSFYSSFDTRLWGISIRPPILFRKFPRFDTESAIQAEKASKERVLAHQEQEQEQTTTVQSESDTVTGTQTQTDTDTESRIPDNEMAANKDPKIPSPSNIDADIDVSLRVAHPVYPYKLALLDPANPYNDLGFRTFSIKHIHRTVYTLDRVLKNRIDSDVPPFSAPLLDMLVGPTHDLYRSRRQKVEDWYNQEQKKQKQQQ